MTFSIDPRREQNMASGPEAGAKVSAALACLQEAHDRASWLESIRDIAANLLGSEEVAVFNVDKDMAVLWLSWCIGIDPNRYVCLDVLREPKLQHVLAGEVLFASANSGEKLLSIQDPVTALVPILVFDVVTEVVVIFRLLPQKTAFDAADRDVCRVLSICASQAISLGANSTSSNEKR
jgi:hypothetical protein